MGVKVNNNDIIRRAFKHILAQGPPAIGAIIDELDSGDPLGYKLIDIQGDIAAGELPNGKTKEFPLDSIADVNAVRRVSVQILLGGYH